RRLQPRVALLELVVLRVDLAGEDLHLPRALRRQGVEPALGVDELLGAGLDVRVEQLVAAARVGLLRDAALLEILTLVLGGGQLRGELGEGRGAGADLALRRGELLAELLLAGLRVGQLRLDRGAGLLALLPALGGL